MKCLSFELIYMKNYCYKLIGKYNNHKMEKTDVRIFLELKSCCDNFVKNPSKEHAYRIATVANNISNEVMQDLSEYCLFPIITSLRNNSLR